MRRALFTALFVAAFVSMPAARPFNSPAVDGLIVVDPADWDADDLAVDDPTGESPWGPNDIDDLWTTFDDTYLYIGIRYQVADNGMIVLLDMGTGTGAADINGLDWYARNFNVPDSLLCEFIIAGWNGSGPEVRRILDPSTTADLTGNCLVATQTIDGWFESEIAIPWETIYESGPGAVLPGAVAKSVALIVGGDNWNGPDSAPDNEGMDGSGAATTLTNFFNLVVDGNGDGVPDGFTGSIAGSVAYEDAGDLTTVATVRAFTDPGGLPSGETQTAPGGGAWELGKLADGAYRVEATATGYGKSAIDGVVVSGGGAVTGVDFLLERAGKIGGEVAFLDGPGAEATVTALDAATGEPAVEEPEVVASTGGGFVLLVPEGDYLVIAEAAGYVADTTTATVTGSDSVWAGTLSLAAVRATGLHLVDDVGNDIESVSTTVSVPASNAWFYATATIEARDDAGRRDLYDVEGRLSRVLLSATKLNNQTPPRGDVRFRSVADTTDIDEIDLAGGIGSFLVADDEIEVLRVFTESDAGFPSGRFKAAIRSAEPEFVELSVSKREMTADDTDEVTVTARLLDVSGNPVRVAGVIVDFSFDGASTGAGSFAIPSVETNSDGEATTVFTATGAGELLVTAAASYLNRPLAPLGDDDGTAIAVSVLPGAAAAVRLSGQADLVGLGQEMQVTAQLVDAFGNAVFESGRTVSFTVQPSSAGAVSPVSVALDADGRGTTVFTAGDARSVVTISATASPSLPIDPIVFLIDDVLLFSDPAAPEPDDAHNAWAAVDLTSVIIGNDPDAFEIRVRFSSDFAGLHLGILLEADASPAGSTIDPFEFPISYAHDDLPDYAITWKYSSNDYGDLRKWENGIWNWWDDEGKQYIPTSDPGAWVAGIDIHDDWFSSDTAWVTCRVPFDIFEGNVPDSIRAQIYVMQEFDGEKRSAFDSAPHDSTLDLDGDPEDPTFDWSYTTTPVTLHEWSPGYRFTLDFPPAPLLSEPAAEPSSIEAGETVLFTLRVADGGGGVGDVLVDLSPIGGSRYQHMRDDGTNGDLSAGDGVFSYRMVTDPGIAGGPYELVATARDAGNISRADTAIALQVTGISTPLRTFVDEFEDDHGPNLFGREGLFYLYPTNQVFVRESFDLREVTIFETSKVVQGNIIPSLAFQVTIGNHPDPADEGTADWNPTFADINIQKIDVYIDAFKGGATEGLPNRQNDFQRWDAWDYAIVMEGWYKGVVISNNQNTPQSWAGSVLKNDRDIILASDFENNTITAVVSREALGDPSTEEIADWDIMVVMTSHDGTSTDNNFGDTRWVNAGVSEWQPGGGDDSDRDPNIIDLVASPGVGKSAGRPQSEMLNYKTDEAVKRSEEGETACILEMTAFEDSGPPVISIRAAGEATVPFIALENAPLYYTAEISDDDIVSAAVFRWRADSSLTGDWAGELEMGYAGGDIWSVDIPVDEVTALVPIAPLDSTRNIEFAIEARDPSGNVATTPLYTMEIPLPVASWETALDPGADVEIRAPEGTFISMPAGAIDLDDVAAVETWFTLGTGRIDDYGAPGDGARSINTIRGIGFEARVDGGGAVFPFERLDEPIDISFHYPQYAVGGIDENLIAVYRWNETTARWIYAGGNVNPFGNLVTIATDRPGTYGLFFSPEFGYDPNEVFSGVAFSPNPFSPNGDGLYEETEISFYLTEEATVTVEIFDIDGNRVRILEKRFPFSAEDVPDQRPRRVTGLVWDGRDNGGRIVPYGIYVTRFTVTFSQAAGQRTIRENHAVAVIK